MRGSKGKVIANGIDSPVKNGLSHKEEEEGEEVQRLAAKVVENVVKLASAAADQRAKDSPPAKIRGCELQRLPTFQIDTVPSPPWSPVDEPVDEEQIDIQLEEEQQVTEPFSEEQRESLRSFIEDILSRAMVVAEKKLKFVGIDDDDDEEEDAEEEVETHQHEEEEEEEEAEKEVDSRLTEEEEAEIRQAAEKVVEEVLSKAEEVVAEKGVDISNLDFPITFEEAPEDVKDVASDFVKEIVGKAITMAEEKSVPTVPFNFEDVDLIKTSGPWYVRVREGFMRVLRTACFCTPRRHDS